jgi:hypothetical protein
MRCIMNTIRRSALGRCPPLLFAALAGCGNNFDPVSKVESVRILASRADKPYAKPGDNVELELLAVDGRSDQSRPMAVFWIPAACVDPFEDAYENCFPSYDGMFARGVDLTPQLVSGSKFSLQVPADTLTRSTAMQSGTAFGDVFAFSMACAGHVEYVGPRGSSPQAVPFACFDSSGRELGAEDFVFAYSRIFVFADRTNANPVIDAVTVDGQTIDPATGLVVDHCVTACPTHAIEMVVPPSSQELDPSNVDVNGNVLREELWIDYYVTAGKVKNDARVLYDPHGGKLASADDLEAPGAAGDATLWGVVHDNRGGVSWMEVPIHAR